MFIYDISGGGGIEPLKDPAQRPVEKTEHKVSQPDSFKSITDKTDLSENNQADSRTTEAAKLVLETIPDVREDKVELARQRLADGFYDQPEVREAIAIKMVQDPETNPIPTDVDEIRSRLQSGYYDNPEVRDVIVKGMIDDAQGE